MSRGNQRRKVLAVTWLVLSVSFLVVAMLDASSPMNLIQAVSQEQLLEQARQRIMNIRRGNFTLDFGVANAGESIEIRQLSHAFLFGADAFFYNTTGNSSLDAACARLFSRLFNYATIPVYMKGYNEFLDKAYMASRTLYLQGIVSYLHSFNASVKCHPVIWQTMGQIPDQVNKSANVTAADRTAFSLQHIQNVLQNFTNVDIFDLVNEMTHVPNYLLGTTGVETWENALAKARSVRSNCTFIANDFNTIAPGDASTSNNDAGRFYDFVKYVVADGYAPGALGFQGHEWMSSWLPLQDIIDTFDAFGTFHIPIHVTEFDPGSKRYYGGTNSIRRGPMTEASQAELATDVYTVLFSHPAVSAITWWSFLEDPWWHPELGDYIVARTGHVLQVYDALYDLFHVQWNSTGTYRLDTEGKLRFTGFYGNYTAKMDGYSQIKFSIVDNRTAALKPWRVSDAS
jgi:endo-1,4-beta-xylanase